MNEFQRKEWLDNLYMNQLMALAAMNKIPEYMVKSRKQLVNDLSKIDGVEIPRQG